MQSNNEIKFGTDGWRGVISDNFTFDNVRRVAQAIADYYNLKLQESKGLKTIIAVGYDTRFLSDKYAEIVSEVLSDNGIYVILSDRPIPTPMLSFTVRKRNLTAGVMITASHNLGEYNGIKIKTHTGGAAGEEVTKEIEDIANRTVAIEKKGLRGAIQKDDLSKDYVKFLSSYIGLKKIKKAKFKVLVDVMYGSGDKFIAQVLKGSKIKLEFTRAEINPTFDGLRPEPIVENLRESIKMMKKNKFDICLVLDGDADRIACIAPGGDFVSPQRILGLLILHLYQDRKMSGGVVKTIVGTNLVDNISKKLGLKLYETAVGFKYISNLMENEDILLGGEEAGGMGFKGYIPERDGTLAGLLLLEMMTYRKKPIHKVLEAMEKEFGRYYYLREDLNVENIKFDQQRLKDIKNILGKEVVDIKDYDGVKFICSDQSWLMLRASGTEPIVRIYAESKTLSKTKRLIEFGKKVVLKG